MAQSTQTDVQPVLAPLETIAGRGFSRYDVFRDWTRLMLAALQRDDDTYLGILDDYDRDTGRERKRGARVADLFSEAFGELMAAMQATNRDVLGDAYEAFGMQNDAFGQHFTPHSVAGAMAEMQTAVGGEDPDPPVTIADPACGSGRMLVYAARRVDDATVCFGMDKDPLCAQMTALNCCFFNMDAAVVCGDSLTLDKRRAWRTRSTAMGGEVAEVDPDDVPWPEAALAGDTDAQADASADGAEESRVVVEADGGAIGQADLADWLE